MNSDRIREVSKQKKGKERESLWVANSMVEYSAFNRLVPGSSPG
jgi:hypothetical protein